MRVALDGRLRPAGGGCSGFSFSTHCCGFGAIILLLVRTEVNQPVDLENRPARISTATAGSYDAALRHPR